MRWSICSTSIRPSATSSARRSLPGSMELFLSYLGVQRAVRDDRWKLICYPQVNVTQLFDLRRDPDETRNLANDPAQARHVKRLLVRLAADRLYVPPQHGCTAVQPP